MVEASFDRRKLDQLLDKLEDLEKMDFTKPMKKSAAILRQEIDDNFAQQGALYQGGGFVRSGGAFANNSRATTRSSSWAPLAPVTQKQRIALGYPPKRPIMIRSGKLLRNFKVKKLTKDEMAIHNDLPFAIMHQKGGDILPQRRLVGFTNKSRAAIYRVFGNYISGIIKGKSRTL